MKTPVLNLLTSKSAVAVLSSAWVLVLPNIANAYIGPGAGLSAIGSLLALLLAVFVAIVGFFWYPIKRLIKGRQGPTLEAEDVTADPQSSDKPGNP